MTIQVRVEVGPGRTSWLRGPGYVIHPAVRAARAPRKYDPVRRAVAIPTRFVDDVVAALELQQGVDVEVAQVLS